MFKKSKIFYRRKIYAELLICIFFCQIFCAFDTRAQELGIILNNNPIDYVDSNDILIQSRLIELALSGPRYKSSYTRLKIDEIQLQKTKTSWLNLLTIGISYNLQNVFNSEKDSINNYYYPSSSIGISIPLGIIFSRSSDIKIKNLSIEQTKNSQIELERSIKAEIIGKYLQYKNIRRSLIMQSRVIDVLQASFLQTEKKFADGIISYSDYNIAVKNLNDEISAKMNLQLQHDLMKLEIERQIGVPLETVVIK